MNLADTFYITPGRRVDNVDLSDWMRLKPERVYEELSDIDVTAIARIVDDECTLGRYIRKRLQAAMEAEDAADDTAERDSRERARDMQRELRRPYVGR